jgi:intracellular sulfur oxidation DsrE/DsrF family protein
MQRRFLSRSVGGLFVAAAVARASTARAEEAPPHRISFHVGSADPMMMNVALYNITAAADHYAAKNEQVEIELVANGPGYAMLRADTSPVKAHITEVHSRFPFVVFSACQRSRQAVAKAEGKAVRDIVQVPEATDVEAGVVRLNELQEQNWSYIRV